MQPILIVLFRMRRFPKRCNMLEKDIIKSSMLRRNGLRAVSLYGSPQIRKFQWLP